MTQRTQDHTRFQLARTKNRGVLGCGMWGKKNKQAAQAPADSAPVRAAPTDAPIDALAAILREYGRSAFDFEGMDARGTQELFEKWAQHIQIGARSPVDFGKARALPVEQRDWPGLREAFAAHRKNETAFIGRSHDDFRQVIWAFLASINKVMADDVQVDDQIKTQLQSLRAAVSANATEELKRLALSTVETIGQVFEQRQQRQQAQVVELGAKLNSLGEQLETARRESTVDALTNLYNRRAFDEQLARTVEISRMLREPCHLLLVDLDHFKRVNDDYGHPTGDAVLKSIAQVLVRTFKRKRDFVARYGGEEFVVVVRDATAPDARNMAGRLLHNVRSTVVEHGEKSLMVTASVGLSQLEAGDTAESWLERADQALYQAKHRGRDQVVEL